MKISLILLLVLVATNLFAAPAKPAAGSKSSDAEKAAIKIQSIKLNEYLTLKTDEVIEKMDSVGKGNPDIFVVFKKNEDGSRQLLRQLFDLNRDKKVDLAKFFEKGKMVRTELDLDYDGIVDVISDYDTRTGELKRKVQADGSTQIWKHYFKNELRKKEVDRNADGKPDMWVYFRSGKIIRTEVDKDFEGHIIRVEGPLNPNKGKKTATSGQKSTLSE